jgi:hypothetical protein
MWITTVFDAQQYEVADKENTDFLFSEEQNALLLNKAQYDNAFPVLVSDQNSLSAIVCIWQPDNSLTCIFIQTWANVCSLQLPLNVICYTQTKHFKLTVRQKVTSTQQYFRFQMPRSSKR